jgi:DNA polymerase V
MALFALIDSDNFYVSVERIFDSTIHDRPVIVLSSGDGCVIARSNEAKALGIQMGAPVFRYRQLIKERHIAVFSSNFQLYQDISDRIAAILATFSEQPPERYSIDECFLSLNHVAPGEAEAVGREIRARILQCIGVPCSVGIAGTKLLTKVAVKLAKRHAAYGGVLSLATLPQDALDEILAQFSIEDLWGIGRRLANRLYLKGIFSAKQYRDADAHWVQKHLHVPGARLQLELKGVSCLPLETQVKPKQRIMRSQTFSGHVEQLEQLGEAIATFAARAGEELRRQGGLATEIGVFIATNRFDAQAPQYSDSLSCALPFPTAFTPDFITAAHSLLKVVYRPGYKFKQAGVYLAGICSQEALQTDLFGEFSLEGYQKKMRLGSIVDLLNWLFGRETLFFGAQGFPQQRTWHPRQERRSKRATTRWSELLTIST